MSEEEEAFWTIVLALARGRARLEYIERLTDSSRPYAYTGHEDKLAVASPLLFEFRVTATELLVAGAESTDLVAARAIAERHGMCLVNRDDGPIVPARTESVQPRKPEPPSESEGDDSSARFSMMELD